MQKTEMRGLLPNNAVAYLEIGDLSKTLEALTGSQAFQELADKIPDFSALENMQIAVAVTGFEASAENSVLNFKPQFVAVAETHLWSWQTVSFAENQLDKFVRKNYGAHAKLETSDKNDGKFFKWMAGDNRQVFAFVQGSLVYFGTDAAAIEKCSAVAGRGGTESLLNNESLTRADAASAAENNLAFGYVSTEGIRQLADFAGVAVAAETNAVDTEAQSFIASVLPALLQNWTREIVWTARRNERGVEDQFSISLVSVVGLAVNETLAAQQSAATASAVEFLPREFDSATRYNLKNPLGAWRGLQLLMAKDVDTPKGRFLIGFSDRLLEPYGISEAERFLGAIDSEIVTARFDPNGERSAVIVTSKNSEELKKSITREINFDTESVKQSNAEIWSSADKKLLAAFVEDKLILGESESVLKCLRAKPSGENFIKNPNHQKLSASQSTAATFARDSDSAEKAVEVLAIKKDANRKLATFYLTETRFTEKGIERRTVSDFGLIGTVLGQLEH